VKLITTTGAAAEYLPPDGPERDELLGLVRLGLKFKAQQHQGRRPGFLHRYITALVQAAPGRMSFEGLLKELAFQARRRELLGESASPIEKIDREWELVTWHCPRRGRKQTTFKRLQNLLATIQKSRHPLTGDGGLE